MERLFEYLKKILLEFWDWKYTPHSIALVITCLIVSNFFFWKSSYKLAIEEEVASVIDMQKLSTPVQVQSKIDSTIRCEESKCLDMKNEFAQLQKSSEEEMKRKYRLSVHVIDSKTASERVEALTKMLKSISYVSAEYVHANGIDIEEEAKSKPDVLVVHLNAFEDSGKNDEILFQTLSRYLAYNPNINFIVYTKSQAATDPNVKGILKEILQNNHVAYKIQNYQQLIAKLPDLTTYVDANRSRLNSELDKFRIVYNCLLYGSKKMKPDR